MLIHRKIPRMSQYFFPSTIILLKENVVLYSSLYVMDPSFHFFNLGDKVPFGEDNYLGRHVNFRILDAYRGQS